MSESKMEELLNDIENIEVNTQGLTTSTAVRLNTLKSTVDYLKDLYSQNKESFVAKYHSKLKQFNSSLNTSQKTFKQIHKMLEEDLKPKYIQEDYKVISETEWKEKVEIDKLSVWEIKRHDEMKVESVNKKVERSVNKEKLCNPDNIKYGTELRIIILGYAGVGKSATGNTIIGKPDYFPESYQIKPQTETVCEGEFEEKDGRKIRVLDTPGLHVIGRSKKEMQLEFAKCYSHFHPGVHAFLLVLNAAAPRFTEHLEAASELKKIFGKKAMNHCILVFTHFDEMPSDYSVRNLMETENKQLGNLIRKEASGRVMVIDNHAMSRYEIEKYKSNLISMIDQMQVQAFSNKVFGELERRRKREEKTEFVSLEKLGEKCLIDILSIKRHLKQKWTREDIDSDSQCMKKVQQELSEEMKILDKMPSEFENAIKVLKQESFGQVEKTSDPLEQSMQFTKKLDLIEPRTSASTKCESLDASGDWTVPVDRILHKYIKKLLDKKIKNNALTELVIKEIPISVRCDSVTVYNYIGLIRRIIKSTVPEVNASVSSVTEKVLLAHKFTNTSMTVPEEEDLAKKVIHGLSAHWDEFYHCSDEVNFDKELTDMVRHKIQKKFEEYKFISETSVDGWCFPANAKVYAPGGKKLSMSDLCIGDKVLTVNSSRVLDYEEIVFLSHADHSAMSDHMVITTDSQQTIRLSPLHLLHVGEVGSLKPACKVQIGDILLVYDSCTIIKSKVISITQKVESGLFCPHTRSGSIIVDDILASCYTDHFEAGKAHFIMSIVDVLYNYLPSWIFQPVYGKSRLHDTPRLFEYVKFMYFSVFGAFQANL